MRIPRLVRGRRAAGSQRPRNGERPVGHICGLERVWADGDTVSFRLPLGLRTHRYEGEDKIPGAERYAVEYGPLLLACVGPLEGGVPRIPHDPARPADWLKPDPRRPLHFRIAGVATHYFAPYWQLSHAEPFTCYPVMTRAEGGR